MPSLTLQAIQQAAKLRGSPQKNPMYGADKGINKKDLPTLLSPEQALELKGAWNIGVGRTEKVKGYTLAKNTGSVVNSFLGRFTSTLYVVCYGTTGAIWDTSANTVTTFKTDFTNNNEFSGAKYGTFFYLCNGGDTIGYVDTAGVWTSIGAAPKAKHLLVWEARLLAGNTDTDESQLHGSRVDDGTGIFDTWTIAEDDGDPFSSINPRMGALNGIGTVGNQLVLIRDEGKLGFHIEYFDVAGSGLQQHLQIDFEKIDFGGFRGVTSTTTGIYYVNQYGLWRLVGGVEGEVQEGNVTSLFDDYIEDFNFDDADIIYMPVEDKILVTCKKTNADANDTILFYDPQTGAVGEISGWNIKRFVRYGDTFYGTSSLNGDIHRLLSGFDANGSSTSFEIEGKELDFGDEERLKDMFNFYIYGKMAIGSSVTIEIDKWDETGNKETSDVKLSWTSDISSIEPVEGAGKLGAGKARRYVSNSFQEVKGHVKIRLKAFTKIKIRVKESSLYPFELNKVVPDKIYFRREVRKHNLVIS